MDTLQHTITAEQITHRGFALWHSPTMSLAADARARVTSQTEAYFLLTKVKPEPEEYDVEEGRTGAPDDDPFTGPEDFGGWGDDLDPEPPTYSYTEVCYCGAKHPC